MAINYKPLWKLLIDRNMSKMDLRKQAKLTTNVLAKLGKDEYISMKNIEKICLTLDCKVEEVMQITKERI